MFSVDNFYCYFNDRYGWLRTGIVPYTPKTHGEKNLWFFQPYGSTSGTKHSLPLFDLCNVTFYLNGCMILYDQEPFDWHHCASTYRDALANNTKTSSVSLLDDNHLMAWNWRSLGPIIFCHSNKNNQDLSKLEAAGFIPTYYFWHGFISRDWFRHWKHSESHIQSIPYLKPYRFLMYIRAEDGTRAYRSKLKQALIHRKDQIVCNWEMKNNTPGDASASIDMHDARISSIQIVPETLFDSDIIYVTEKCFKPMVMRQPFLVFSAPGTLAYLRSYGFKTFSDVWDESYDQEKDHSRRFQKLIQLIEKLVSMPWNEFETILNKCQTAVNHNLKHFFSQDFEDHMLLELEKNMQTALNLHGQMAKEDPGGSFFRLRDSLRIKNIDDGPVSLQYQKIFIEQLRSRYPVRYDAICKQYPWVSTA